MELFAYILFCLFDWWIRCITVTLASLDQRYATFRHACKDKKPASVHRVDRRNETFTRGFPCDQSRQHVIDRSITNIKKGFYAKTVSSQKMINHIIEINYLLER